MQTVWVELLEVLKENGKDWNQVKYVTKLGQGISKEEFKEQAKYYLLDYDIDPSLKVVGDGWWVEVMCRNRFVWLEFKVVPDEPRQFLENPSILYNPKESLWY